MSRLFDWVDYGLRWLECWMGDMACCPFCLSGFVPRGTGRTKKRYCSPRCASLARSRTHHWRNE